MKPFWLLLLTLIWIPSDSFKILVYNSRYGHSHSNFVGIITDILAEAGHNVTSLIPVMNPKAKDGTLNSSQVLYAPEAEMSEEDRQKDSPSKFFDINVFDWRIAFKYGPIMGCSFGRQCRTTINHPGLIEQLAAERYDVYIAETFDMCGIGLAPAIGAKSVIGLGSSVMYGPQYDEIGVPMMPSFNPGSYITHMDVHSMSSRAWNVIGEWLFRRFMSGLRTEAEAVLKERFGTEYPSLQDIISNVAYFFTNAEPLIDFSHPTLHKTIRRFPNVTFIWKYENLEDEFSAKAKAADNLILTHWMPQGDLLNDSRLSAFITHAGMGSVHETSRRGVPALLVPLFSDQPRNAGMMEANGLGKVFDKFDLSNEDKLTAAVRDILDNPEYRKNAKRISEMLKSKPFKPKELVVKYVEFAAEFGPSPSLRPQSLDMSFLDRVLQHRHHTGHWSSDPRNSLLCLQDDRSIVQPKLGKSKSD